MQRTGLKTFVYSFIVALFTLVGVSEVFLHTKTSKIHTPVIPSKNIALFIKQSRVSPSAASVPVKKISLSVLSEPIRLQKKVLGVVYEPDDVIMADVVDDDVLFVASAETAPDLSLGLVSKKVMDMPLDIPHEFDSADDILDAEVRVALVSEAEPKAVLERKPELELSPKLKHNPLLELELELEIETGREPDKIAFVAAEEVPSVSGSETLSLYGDGIEGNFDLLEERKSALALPVVVKKEKKLLIPLVYDGSAGVVADAIVRNKAAENQVALAGGMAPVGKVNAVAIDSLEVLSDKKQWLDMNSTEESPWEVAKSNAKPRNRLLSHSGDVGEAFEHGAVAVELSPSSLGSGAEVDMASETINNLLIPIPEDILKEGDLVPRLVSGDSKGREVEMKDAVEDDEDEAVEEEAFSMKKLADFDGDNTEEEGGVFSEKSVVPEKKKSLLTSLGTIFSSVKKQDGESSGSKSGGFFEEVKEKLSRKKLKGKIMPREMRLSFRPNRAEISGQTLRWVQAFANKAAESNFVFIEIRIDGTSERALQQKRLNLLHNILTNSNVGYKKINVVFTDREANSFIIKTIEIKKTGANAQNKSTKQNNFYTEW